METKKAKRSKERKRIEFKTETVPIESLKPHERNYREHPEDQLDHVAESIRSNGVYRNVVVAKDGTILAGHGVVLAAKKLGLKEIPVVRLPFGPNDPMALKVITGDNEVAKLSIVDDRVLTEMLREIKETDPIGLLGTGFDERMLAALTMVTRPESEIKDFNEAAEWAGMPEYTEEGGSKLKIIVVFETEADRAKFMKLIKAKVINKKVAKAWSIYWPEKPKQNLVGEIFK